MTRVNLVPVKELHDQHLMAEYREIAMVVAALKRSLRSRGNDASRLWIPDRFSHGRGHVSFFYNKGRWLYERYEDCVSELRSRGFKLNPDRMIDWHVFTVNGLWNTDWEPDQEEIDTSRRRIEEKIAMKPDWYRRTQHEA